MLAYQIRFVVDKISINQLVLSENINYKKEVASIEWGASGGADIE